MTTITLSTGTKLDVQDADATFAALSAAWEHTKRYDGQIKVKNLDGKTFLLNPLHVVSMESTSVQTTLTQADPAAQAVRAA
jgi:uncharacterized protein YlzI (FlbEa/FlbD family)